MSLYAEVFPKAERGRLQELCTGYRFAAEVRWTQI